MATVAEPWAARSASEMMKPRSSSGTPRVSRVLERAPPMPETCRTLPNTPPAATTIRIEAMGGREPSKISPVSLKDQPRRTASRKKDSATATSRVADEGSEAVQGIGLGDDERAHGAKQDLHDGRCDQEDNQAGARRCDGGGPGTVVAYLDQ